MPSTSVLPITPALDRLRETVLELVGVVPAIGLGIVVVVITVIVARWVSTWRRPYRRVTNPFLKDLIRQAVGLAALVLGILIALEIMGATAFVGAVLGTAGVAGLAIGLAFRDLVENYIAGILLSVRQPFAPDDHVLIDDQEGRVLRLTMRATILMTLDGNHLRLSNSKVFKGTILNYSRNPTRRFEVNVGVGVNEDLLEAQGLGIAVLSSIGGVLADPAPSAIIKDLGDSNVLVSFRAWVDQRSHGFERVKGEAIRLVKCALEGAQIDMPEPIYRVKLEGSPSTASASEATPRRRRELDARPIADEGLVATDELRTAIENDRQLAGEDLLDPGASRE